MNELILAIAHHLAVFCLAGVMAAEWTLLRPGIGGARLGLLTRIDIFYGVFAAIILVVGFARVFSSPMGSEFYTQNPVFQMKLGAFALVGLLSIPASRRPPKWSFACAGSSISRWDCFC